MNGHDRISVRGRPDLKVADTAKNKSVKCSVPIHRHVQWAGLYDPLVFIQWTE
jgi:hypothetical protein